MSSDFGTLSCMEPEKNTNVMLNCPVKKSTENKILIRVQQILSEAEQSSRNHTKNEMLNTVSFRLCLRIT
jgi:hypothetical protein